MWAGLAAAGLDLAGGLFSNKKNIDLAREQMDFQREMASTQYQRSAKDLEKAGLNRILALGSPAASPAGARPNITNPAAGVANSAKNVGLLKNQSKLLQSQANAADATASAAWGQEWLNEMKAQTEIANKNFVETNARSVGLQNQITLRKLIEYEKHPDLMYTEMIANPVSVGISGARALGAGLSKIKVPSLKSLLPKF